MINIDKIKQKKLNELIDYFVNAIPPLKKELQDLANKPNIDENEIWDLFRKYEKKAKWELRQIYQTIKKRLEKEKNITI